MVGGEYIDAKVNRSGVLLNLLAVLQEVYLPIIHNNFPLLLNDRPGFRYPFDSLPPLVKKMVSSDQKLRVFSWDNLDSTTPNRTYSVVCQYKSAAGRPKGALLTDGYYNGMDAFQGVLIDDVQVMQACNTTSYLLSGWKVEGVNHTRVWQIVQVIQDKLVVYQQAFAGQKKWNVTVADTTDLTHSFKDSLLEVKSTDRDGLVTTTRWQWKGCRFEQIVK